MGILDELEQQAQQRKASADSAEKRKAEREEVFRTQLEPGMVALYEFLGKLVANLKLLQPRKQVRHDLLGYGEVVGYIEHDYELKVSQQPGSREITLSFPCLVSSEECPTVEVLGASKVKTVAGAFQRYHLGGVLEPKKDGNGEVVSAKFNAKGRITLSASFFADAESAGLRMTFVNFDALGSATKNVPAAQLNEALFDAIGRFVMREPSNLFQEALPDSFRAQLRTKVQQDQIKRRWESKISEQQKAELEQMRREQGFGARFARRPAAPATPAAPGAPAASPSWLDRIKGLVGK